jgi:hypothetical protein
MVRRSYDVDNPDGQNVFFDAPVDTSNLPSNQESVVEPRVAPVPGSILSCSANDAASCAVVEGDLKFVVTYCTALNVERVGPDGRPVHAPGLDCNYSWTADGLDSMASETVIDENGDEIEAPAFDCLACQNDLRRSSPRSS